MKKLFTICVLFVLIMLWIVLYPNYTFAVVENNPTTTNDSNYLAIELAHAYDNLLSAILSKESTTNRSALLSQLAMGRSYIYFFDNTNTGKLYLSVYNNTTPILGGGLINLYDNNNSLVMVDGYTIDTVHTFRIDLNYGGNASVTKVADNERLNVPNVLYNYFGEPILQCLKDTGYISTDSSVADVVSGLASINANVVAEGNQTQQAIGSMQNATTGAIGTMQNQVSQKQQQTTNAVGQMSNTINNRIEQQQVQSQQNYEQFTNTSYYDNSVTTIDTQDIYGDVSDPNGTIDFLFTIYDHLEDAFTGQQTRAGTTAHTITLPFPGESLTLSSQSMLDFYHNYPVIDQIIRLFWTFYFGKFYFTFCYRIYIWLANGDVLNLKSFTKEMNNFQSSITQDMM